MISLNSLPVHFLEALSLKLRCSSLSLKLLALSGHRARQIQNAMGEQLAVELGSDGCRKLGYIRLVASH